MWAGAHDEAVNSDIHWVLLFNITEAVTSVEVTWGFPADLDLLFFGRTASMSDGFPHVPPDTVQITGTFRQLNGGLMGRSSVVSVG